MIKIPSNFNRLLTPIDQTVLDAPRDYPAAYGRILKLLQNHQSLTVVVRYPAVGQWLKNLSLRYPPGAGSKMGNENA